MGRKGIKIECKVAHFGYFLDIFDIKNAFFCCVLIFYGILYQKCPKNTQNEQL
jgi:hypothetical protein